MKNIFVILAGILIGFVLGFFIPLKFTASSFVYPVSPILSTKTVIGFLPYWLSYRASSDYSKYITDLTYFDLGINADGSILKLDNQDQEDPGWHALSSEKLKPFFENARRHNVSLSLLVFCGNPDTIQKLVSRPVKHALLFASQVKPILNKYGFSDLNLDIEYTPQASLSAQEKFTKFVQEIRSVLPSRTSLTIEIMTSDVVRQDLINPSDISSIANRIVLMAYDYHSPSSFVTGAVSPLFGAGIRSEYDVQAAILNSLKVVPSSKLILGMPLYGYQWETLSSNTRSADIPGSGIVASNRRAEQFLSSCASCSALMNNYSKEPYIIYYDYSSGVYNQIFYPDSRSTQNELNLASKMKLGGVALWALGYEGNSILSPLSGYKKEITLF